MRRMFVLLILSVFALFCVGSLSEAERVLTFSFGEPPVTLDPQDHNNRPSYIINSLVYEGLTRIAPKEIEPGVPGGELSPCLATSWESLDGAKTWTFYLRKGVKFHNGESFDAQAVKYSLDRILNNSELRHHSNLINLEKVEIKDDYTVVIHLSKPDSSFPNALAMFGMILPPLYSEEHSLNGKLQWPMDPIGTGPFKFVQYIPGQEWTAERYPEYWGWGTAVTTNVNKVVFKVIEEISTRLAALQTGDIDLAEGLLPEMVPILEADPNLGASTILTTERMALFMRFGNGIFDDVRVQKAVKYAIDRDALVTVMGNGLVSENFIPVAMYGSNPHLVPHGYNPEKAKKLLAEAGYPNGLDLEYITGATWFPKQDLLAAALQQQLAAAGIRIKIFLLATGACLERRANEDYDLLYTTDSYNDTLARLRKFAGNCYYQGWEDANFTEFLRLIDEAAAQVDPSVRDQVLMHIDSLVHERGPTASISQAIRTDGYNKRVSGLNYWYSRWWLFDVQLP